MSNYDVLKLSEMPNVSITIKPSDLQRLVKYAVDEAIATVRRQKIFEASDRLVTVPEAARMLGKSTRTMRRMADRGTLVPFKSEGVLVYKHSELMRYIAEYSEPIK